MRPNEYSITMNFTESQAGKPIDEANRYLLNQAMNYITLESNQSVVILKARPLSSVDNCDDVKAWLLDNGFELYTVTFNYNNGSYVGEYQYPTQRMITVCKDIEHLHLLQLLYPDNIALIETKHA